MIVTCASCLTKFNLDDSRVPPKGAKVRCSRCKHVFFVPPPAPQKEEVVDDIDSFARYLKEEGELAPKGPGAPPKPAVSPKPVEEEDIGIAFGEEEAKGLAIEEAPPKLKRRAAWGGGEEERPVSRPSKPEMRVRREKKGPSLIFAVIIILVLLLVGAFYLWSELESGGKLASYLNEPIKKATHLWERILGTDKKNLPIRDLNQYQETVGDVPLLVVEGQVSNQSSTTKKYIKVRVSLFDQNRNKVAEKETFCGRALSRDELKRLSPDALKGDLSLAPQTEKERQVPPGKSFPFVVVFGSLPSQAREFNVEVVEAPNL